MADQLWVMTRIREEEVPMRKALSPHFSLDRGVNGSASVADRRVIEQGHAVIGCSKGVM